MPQVPQQRRDFDQLIPSMEGRAIVRPNLGYELGSHRRRCAFNGGPGNCPAELGPPGPGAAVLATFNGGPGNCPAVQIPSPPRFGADWNLLAPARLCFESVSQIASHPRACLNPGEVQALVAGK